jgi:hypothetical protein
MLHLSDQKRHFKVYHEAIRKVLMSDWDPCCVAECESARDEYDDYIPGIYSRLFKPEAEKELLGYLLEIATEWMGLPGYKPSIERTVQSLLKLRDNWNK